MKPGLVIGALILLMGCSERKIEQPEKTGISFQMVTEGAERFEDYIHTLNIYAFRRQADGSYVYYRTVNLLNQEEIAALKEGSVDGSSKFLEMNLPVGSYEICMVGNVPENLAEGWVEGITTPDEGIISGNPHGQDSVYFVGNEKVKIVGNWGTPLKVTLNRVVSKLVLVLYEVPVQIDSVRLTLGNLATEFSIAGLPVGAGKEIVQDYPVRNTADGKDTIVGELVTLPSLSGGSPMQITFYAKNGQEKTKEMPIQTLLPNKYVRIVGVVSDTPGGLLRFEINVKLLLIDYFYKQSLPDFVLKHGGTSMRIEQH